MYNFIKKNFFERILFYKNIVQNIVLIKISTFNKKKFFKNYFLLKQISFYKMSFFIKISTFNKKEPFLKCNYFCKNVPFMKKFPKKVTFIKEVPSL